VFARVDLGGVCEDWQPDLGGPSALGGACLASQPPGLFKNRQGALDLTAFLVAAVLFPDQLCARG